MKRRAFLATIGAAGSGLLAGCLSSAADDQAETTSMSKMSATATTPETTTMTDGEPTVKAPQTTTVGDIDTKLSFGEWAQTDRYAFSITSTGTMAEFQDTFNDRNESFPDGMQMGYGVILAKNITPETIFVPDNAVATMYLLVDGHVYEPQEGFEHPDYDGRVDMDWISVNGVESRYQYASAKPFESGEKRKFWFGHLIPEDIQEKDLHVGAGMHNSGDFNVVWGY